MGKSYLWLLVTEFHIERRTSQPDKTGCMETKPTVEITLRGIDLIFPFSENWPANYNFSLFSKLPTNYPKNQKIFKKQSIFSENTGVPPYFRLFFEYFFIFGVICW